VSEVPAHDPEAPSESLARRVDQVCNRFEAAWKAGAPPRLEDFLGDVPGPERAALLGELVPLDVYYRRARGEECRPEEYRGRFPDLDPARVAGTTTVPDGTGTGDAPAGPAAPPAAANQLGARPRYTRTRLHGKGGIGQVWLARDESLGRDVALKELRPDWGNSPLVTARFLEEAQITGQLEHPGIVPVYELVQPPDGRPCYAMRFVGGRTLADAIADYHGRRQAGKAGPLELRELLGVFVGVCNAVAYAHSRGVLHRDLKPQNVALGDFGEVLVLDWGLAKVLGNAEEPTNRLPVALGSDGSREETHQGQVLGTPAYMAPEQAEGRADLVNERSDVYGMGAILYEILTAEPPFGGPNPQEVLRRVVQEPPVPPRQRVLTVPPALEAACLKALAKEPAARYGSARELAREVGRWLADEPVTAYREPVAARLGRWGRRHKTAVASGAVLLLTAVAALAVGLVAVNAERARTAQANLRLVEEQGKTQAAYQAEARRRRQAREALDAMSSEAIDDWLAKQKELTEQQKKFLEGALTFYEAFARDTGQDESSRAGVAGAYYRVGRIRQPLGQLAAAEEAYRTSQERYARLADDFPAAAAYRQGLARSHVNLGIVLTDSGRAPEAQAEFQHALVLLQRLSDDFPTVPDYRQDLAQSHVNLGTFLMHTGRFQKAEGEYRQTLALYQRLADDFPAVPAYRQELAKSHANLGLLLAETGRVREAEEESRRALAHFQRLTDDFPKVSAYQENLARSHAHLAVQLTNTGRVQEAEGESRQALTLYQRLVADFPALPEYRQVLATSHNNLGIVFWSTGRSKEAEGEYRRALALQQRLVDDFPAVPAYRQELARGHDNMGVLLCTTGRAQEAEKEFRQALALRQRLADDFPNVPGYRQELASSHNNFGILLKDTGRFQEAEREFRQALALGQRLADNFPTVPDYQNEVAGTLVNFALLEQDRQDFAKARRLLEEALPHHQAALKANPRHPVYRAFFRNNTQALADILLHLGAHVEAAMAADRLAQVAVDLPSDLYNAACYLARCGPLAEKDDKLPEAKRKELARQYVDRALATLGQAVDKGYKDVEHLKKDPDLDPLRGHDDYRKLLSDIEDKAKDRK
jgi:serine/threonine-protein kinase